jgi:hypothetical protein
MISLIIASTLAMIFAFPASGIDQEAPIMGCDRIDCPKAPGTNFNECRVVDREFNHIGLATVKNSLSKNFTWAVGVHNTRVDPVGGDPFMAYERNFFFGSPGEVNLPEGVAESSFFGGCALFFTNVSKSVDFQGNGPLDNSGTCEDAMSPGCVAALSNQAVSAVGPAKDQSSVGGLCQTLRKSIADNLVSECSRFAIGNNWAGLEVRGKYLLYGNSLSFPNKEKPHKRLRTCFVLHFYSVSSFDIKWSRLISKLKIALTGKDAERSVAEIENSNSNCYPTFPKTNSLGRVAAFNRSGTGLSQDFVPNMYGITPILTVFFPVGNISQKSLLQKAEAELTCLKVVGSMELSDSGRENGSAPAKFGSDRLVLLMALLLFILA